MRRLKFLLCTLFHQLLVYFKTPVGCNFILINHTVVWGQFLGSLKKSRYLKWSSGAISGVLLVDMFIFYRPIGRTLEMSGISDFGISNIPRTSVMW